MRFGMIVRTDPDPPAAAAREASRIRCLLAASSRFQVEEEDAILVHSEEALLRELVEVVHRHDVDMILSWEARRCTSWLRTQTIAP